MTEVEIGIYTHRWSSLQVKAIQSIAEHTKNIQYSILVNQQPGNCHQNLNRIWKRFTAPYVVIIDEDVEILQDDWLERLIATLESDLMIGATSCSHVKTREYRRPTSAGTLYVPWIPAYLMAFKRERVPFLGFDEKIPGDMGMTDLDASLQIWDEGLVTTVNRNVVVYHPSRDDDATRYMEARPTVAQQKNWFEEQSTYMKGKWGTKFDDALKRGVWKMFVVEGA